MTLIKALSATTMLLTATILPNVAIADDYKLQSFERTRAAAQLDRDHSWIHRKVRELWCDRECQIDDTIEEIRNQPIGSLGIRG